MVVKIKNSVVFITIECTWEEKCAVYSKAFVPGISAETNPFNRTVRFKLLSIIVWGELEVLWWISSLMDQPSEWVPETKQIFTPILCEICGNEKCLCLFCQFARAVAGMKKCTCFWTALVGYILFQTGICYSWLKAGMCALGLDALRGREMPPEMNCWFLGVPI